MRRSTVRAWARIGLAAGVVAMTASLVSLPAHAEDDASGEIGISVPVIGTTAPSPAGSGLSGRGPSSSGANSGAGEAVATDAADPQPAATDMLIAGGLYVSDIGGSSRPTVNPFEGRAELWVTLRNMSTETVDLTADFSIAVFTGALIADGRVQVDDLKPGETRVVDTSLSGTGQWPFVIGRVTVDPPDEIAGQQTAAVSRATVVYVWPWLGMIGLVLAALAIILLRLTARVSLAAPSAAAGVA